MTGLGRQHRRPEKLNGKLDNGPKRIINVIKQAHYGPWSLFYCRYSDGEFHSTKFYGIGRDKDLINGDLWEEHCDNECPPSDFWTLSLQHISGKSKHKHKKYLREASPPVAEENIS